MPYPVAAQQQRMHELTRRAANRSLPLKERRYAERWASNHRALLATLNLAEGD